MPSKGVGMAGPALDLGLEGGRWQLYRDPPRQPPVGVTVGGNGGDALMHALLNNLIKVGQGLDVVLKEPCCWL